MKVPAHQISFQAKQAHEADPLARFILLRLPLDAFDGTAVDVNAASWPVSTCSSPLAVRDAMRRYAASTTPVVLLFAGDESELGSDVLARCTKRRAITHDLWQTVLALFRAAHIDPRLARHRWLAELLVRYMPAEGYAPVRSLVLDQDRAWKELFKVVLGFESYPPTELDLLRWAGDAQRREQIKTLEDPARQETVQCLRETLGDLVDFIFAAIDTGSADELVAIAMLCEALEDKAIGSESNRAKVAARLEVLFDGLTISSHTIHQLAGAADAWFDRASEVAKQQQVARYESLVTQLKAEPLAAQARYGITALREKTKAFAAALNDINLPEAISRFGRLMAHRGPVLSSHSELRCKMALRLVSWLRKTVSTFPSSLNALSERYRNEIGWVDWAQTVLLEGDDSPDLANAYGLLREKTRIQRDLFDQRFAESLAADKPDGTTLIAIEDALDKCVAPVVVAGRCLLIVVDGMSVPVFLELHHSLKEHGWVQFERSEGACSTLLTMLPSTTEASRTSLLCGIACAGSASTERAAFSAYPALVAPSVAGKPPAIFHKRDLLDASGVALSDDLRTALSDTRQRVVAVVINAVDDHLMKSDQLRLRWDIAQFKGLDALLAEARSSERAVVFTSDHGHVLDQDTVMLGASPNARWREPSLESYPGEIALTGNRVKAASGMDEVVLAWNSKLRYATKRNGYHGGCAPAEALVPIATYRYGAKAFDGWSIRDEVAPDWWQVDRGGFRE
ncbi:pglZ domain protein [Burkholderia thailandensis E264]|uniref:Bacteriophage phiC31 resistance protein pglZ, putative n=1 Tax=Burkholderia thailandensis (strain ATCC 700388 / DSM 13276 / CCUG 48851 / CIP 106301 / E264) TaxID=271848 RepID=Q2T2C3_BURTA|nr:BREX-2 system phosphatase PglZ [Burkholderia thailandensis]ABC37150.1 bacteriophage phiC31 resistance protein pglZ, putative [Burkholderia thailandensis E264]AHI74012.1 pglZ domain protein [Burkholderia thailandensis 2002721723]AIP25402.1 pglZ domain protein [Burkholderia thailandensis E264]AJX98785.1 pglZ domain protein [Burkholderia thailandensis 2002721643]NBC90914.1 BREX-2 system phosphatase PglZ [Burkholderia thailandensis]